MCTALRDAGIQSPHWETMADKLGIQLQISASEFFKGWCAYGDVIQPSWRKLAEALERIDIPSYREAAEIVRNSQGTAIYLEK